MDSEVTEIEKKIYQLNSISTSLKLLLDFCITKNDNDNDGPIIAVKYGVLELAHFIKYYESLMGDLDDSQKKLVLCLCPHIKNIMKIKEPIKYMRNHWVGHITEEGRHIEDFSMNHDNPDMPKDVSEYYGFYFGVILFVNQLSQILLKENMSLMRKLSKNITSMDMYPFDINVINQKINDKKQEVIENLRKNGYTGLIL